MLNSTILSYLSEAVTNVFGMATQFGAPEIPSVYGIPEEFCFFCASELLSLLALNSAEFRDIPCIKFQILLVLWSGA
jgi:hypothetical protein